MKKTLTIIKLAELFFEKIALKYEILNDISKKSEAEEVKQEVIK